MKYPKGWLTYDWNIDGIPAVFEVDLDLYDSAPSASHDVLFFVNCISTSLTADMTSRAMRAKCESVIRKCLKVSNQQLAGIISNAEMLQFYTYGTDIHALTDIEDCIRQAHGIITRVGAQPEPRWQTYMKLLYPDAAKYQTVKNGEQIELMHRYKDLIYPSRKLSLHVFTKTEPLRLMFEEQARLSGFAIGEAEFDDHSDHPYGVCLHVVSTLNKPDVDEITTRVIRLAKQFEGKLVGWDCAIMKRTKLK